MSERTAVHLSVVYRTGPLTVADYDEAIEALQAARAALLDPLLMARGCGICGDACTPNTCHHNPLVLARIGAECSTPRPARLGSIAPVPIHYFQCFHCDFVPASREEAREHYGDTADTPAACQRPARLLTSARRVLAGTSPQGGEAKALARQVIEALASTERLL